MWELKDLIEWCGNIQEKINGKWVPSCPTYRYYTLGERLERAWAVFSNKADAFKWPEGQ